MVNKNKNTAIHNIGTVASHAGMLVMLAATMVSMGEHARHTSHQIVTAITTEHAQHSKEAAKNQAHADEQTRRKEEIRHTSASYGAMIRHSTVSGTV